MKVATKNTKPTKLAGATKTEKKANYVIDPETGKKISRAGLAMRNFVKRPAIAIVDMRAVLK